jgi:eukaryotic-like serine/threonine-protein kinase
MKGNSSDPETRIGEVVSGRYALDSVLGTGGQGAVYRARDLKDGDEVAIKVLHTKVANNRIARERMFREAKALVSLWGTGAVRILDQGWTIDGSFCLVMELLHGQDLGMYIDQFTQEKRKVPVKWAMDIFEPVVVTLERAHQRGILHRDIKPGNIFVLNEDHGGGVRLLDFGFAKFVGMPKLTAVGYIAGSPTYIAPESWLGEEQVDRRIDIYALSAVIFHTLAGEPPFSGRNAYEMMKVSTTSERPSLHRYRPDLPKDIDEWVLLALAIHPEERFQSVRAMWNALSWLSR